MRGASVCVIFTLRDVGRRGEQQKQWAKIRRRPKPFKMCYRAATSPSDHPFCSGHKSCSKITAVWKSRDRAIGLGHGDLRLPGDL